MTGTLQQVSDAMADLVERVGPGIVRVEARSRMPASGLVWSADGLIVTAHHVVERDEGIYVGLAGGERVEATLVGRDASTDIAVLRCAGQDWPVSLRSDAGALRVGNLVLALGRPGRTVQATLGIVSALGDGWRTPAGGHVDRYLQTDVVMYPGFSGGPLVEAGGQIVGINTSALLRGTSLALPVETLTATVETLVQHGRIPRGYLGIGLQSVRLPAGLQEDLDQESGLMVMSVEAGSPASQAGIVQGDIIVTFYGQAMGQPDDLQQALTKDRVGKQTDLRLIRGGQPLSLSVVVGQRQ